MRIIYFCHLCGEPIREGDTAFLLNGFCFCPGCVEHARIVARPPEETFEYRYPRRGSHAAGFPSGIPRRSGVSGETTEIHGK